MIIEDFTNRKKILKLSEELLFVEEDYLEGCGGVTMNELESYVYKIKHHKRMFNLI